LLEIIAVFLFHWTLDAYESLATPQHNFLKYNLTVKQLWRDVC